MEFDLKEHCLVSSFSPIAMKLMEEYSVEQGYKVRTIYIQNFNNDIKLPLLEELINMGDGVNV